MKILLDGEPEELKEFFCLTPDRREKTTHADAENFWQTLISGLVECYKAPLQGHEKGTSD